MINTEIIAKVYELKEKLINSKEYKLVKDKEKLMEEKANELLTRYNYLFNEYNEAKRFENYGGKVKEYQKLLADTKLELDRNEYVIEYRKAYKDMEQVLSNIQDILFKDII